MWRPGEVIVHQETWKGRVWAARPLVVVEDEPDRLVLWLPAGTVRKVPMTPPIRPDAGERKAGIVDLLEKCDWVYVDHVWKVSNLWILHPGDWHAVWIGWFPGGETLGWYINLQEPFQRTPIGIEAMDMMLDVVVDPDRTWSWKDEDEFDDLLARGIFEERLGEKVRSEARRVIAALEASRPPFDHDWHGWSAPAGWGVPTLPEGWDVTHKA
ncbi:MAG TPA: DUF402 domain-containing protein [Acidimicrobiales bacterium]|nr:DUF402 domain-containing protein [Acidimicrobiales bacterium]